LLDWAVKNEVPVMLATTGQTEDELVAVKAASEKIPVFFSANMSLGVAVLCSLVRRAAEAFPDADIEIVETHHNRKLDAPSGTALALAGAIKSVREDANLVLGRSGRQKREKRDVGISSVRLGNVVGIHEVMISTGSETLTLKHEAHSRAVFADGAVLAAEFLSGKPAGLYTMEDLKEKK
jgi:4-hydroxy-tetrahydrodipicolinate reductase